MNERILAESRHGSTYSDSSWGSFVDGLYCGPTFNTLEKPTMYT